MSIPFEEECSWALTFARIFVTDHCLLYITDWHVPWSLPYLHHPNGCATVSWSTEDSFRYVLGGKKNQRLLVLFSFNKIEQCFLLPAFSGSLPIVFYAFRICERKVEYIGFSKHDDVGCFPHIYLFFVRSVHVSWKWCPTKHSLGNPVLESKAFE